jgi:hypothetical protein
MALPLVIPNCVQVRLLWILTGTGGVNVLHAITTGSVTVNQTLANTIGSGAKAAFTARLAPLMTGGVALARVGVRDLRGPNLAEFLDSGAVTPGTGVGDPLPSQLAACITLRTANSGKSFRGRAYISGFSEAENDASGTTVVAANTAAVNFLADIQALLQANGMNLAVATRPAEAKVLTETTNHNDGTTTVRTLSRQTAKNGLATAVNAIVARDAAWQTQRRRNNGRGSPPTLFSVYEKAI